MKSDITAGRPADAARKKTDRRTLYTLRVIKDALLELLECQPFEKITVASLCRQAEVTRATFYLHYQDLNDVLNELLEEALMVAEAASNEMSLESRMNALYKLFMSGSSEDLRMNEKLLSPCQRVADDEKYRAIFQDTTLSNYVIKKIYMMERDEMIPYLMRKCRITRDEADKLFMMNVYGLFYMNRAMKWVKDDRWYDMQLLLSRFMLGGFDALSRINESAKLFHYRQENIQK